jgi:hypothetical protein
MLLNLVIGKEDAGTIHFKHQPGAILLRVNLSLDHDKSKSVKIRDTVDLLSPNPTFHSP